MPTFVEQGFDVAADQWAGVLAPARTPRAVVGQLNTASIAVMNEPEVRTRLAQTGTVPAPNPPEDFRRYVSDEYARWGRIIREKGIKAE